MAAWGPPIFYLGRFLEYSYLEEKYHFYSLEYVEMEEPKVARAYQQMSQTANVMKQHHRDNYIEASARVERDKLS